MKTLLLAFILLCPGYVSAQVLTTIPVIAENNNHPHDYSFGPSLLPGRATLIRVVFDSRDRLRGDQTISVVINRSSTRHYHDWLSDESSLSDPDRKDNPKSTELTWRLPNGSCPMWLGQAPKGAST
jgi:hypothetical protein